MTAPQILLLLIALLMSAIFYQDIKFRTVDVRVLVLLLLGAIGYNYFSPLVTFFDAIYALGFLILLFALAFLYYSIKSRVFYNPVDKEIGLGDLVFFIIITPLFSMRDYALFFTTGLIFSLLLFYLVRSVFKLETIPLAGYMALYFNLVVLSNYLLGLRIFKIV